MTRTHALLSRRRGLTLLATALGCLITTGGAPVVRADGGVLGGVVTLLQSGDTAAKIDLVFLGDGFTRDQQDDYNGRVDQAVNAFLGAHPIKALRSAFNIHRVNVISPESGTDKFARCGMNTDTGDPTNSTNGPGLGLLQRRQGDDIACRPSSGARRGDAATLPPTCHPARERHRRWRLAFGR